MNKIQEAIERILNWNDEYYGYHSNAELKDPEPVNMIYEGLDTSQNSLTDGALTTKAQSAFIAHEMIRLMPHTAKDSRAHVSRALTTIAAVFVETGKKDVKTTDEYGYDHFPDYTERSAQLFLENGGNIVDSFLQRNFPQEYKEGYNAQYVTDLIRMSDKIITDPKDIKQLLADRQPSDFGVNALNLQLHNILSGSSYGSYCRLSNLRKCSFELYSNIDSDRFDNIDGRIYTNARRAYDLEKSRSFVTSRDDPEVMYTSFSQIPGSRYTSEFLNRYTSPDGTLEVEFYGSEAVSIAYSGENVEYSRMCDKICDDRDRYGYDQEAILDLINRVEGKTRSPYINVPLEAFKREFGEGVRVTGDETKGVNIQYPVSKPAVTKTVKDAPRQYMIASFRSQTLDDRLEKAKETLSHHVKQDIRHYNERQMSIKSI